MSFPGFYDPQQVGTVFQPRTDAAVRAGTAATLPPASADSFRTVLLLVDPQIDFIHTEGSLHVPGAIEDTRRTIEWIFRHTHRITEIVVSLDSHFPQHIFSPSWWQDQHGICPDPFTIITADDLRKKLWHPVFEAEWSYHYVDQLEKSARKQLMIWPYHTLIGTTGHSITPALYEAITYHAAARRTQPNLVLKGTLARVEHYSIFEPEVKIEETAGGGINTYLLEHIATFDRIYVAGQAKSHCVLESIASMMRYFSTRPEIIRRIHMLTDAMSSVVNPAVDFEAIASAALNQFTLSGLQLRTTDDPV
jgi:nicotinamidase-related amidase